MKKQDATTKGEANSFDDLLRTHRRGAANALASRYLDQITAAVTERGGAGELTLKVKVKSAGENELRVELQVSPPKLPVEKLPEAIYWYDEDAETPRILKRDPRQGELPLREVEREAAEPVAPAEDAGLREVANG